MGDSLIISNNVFNDFFIKNIKSFKINGRNQFLEFENEKISLYSKNYFSCPPFIGKGYAYHLLENSWRKKRMSYLKYLLKKVIGKSLYYKLIAYKALKTSPYYKQYLIDRKK